MQSGWTDCPHAAKVAALLHTKSLSDALYGQVKPEFFRILSSPAARLYVDALDALEKAAVLRPNGIEREDALALVLEAVEAHSDVVIDSTETAVLSVRDKARVVLETLRRAGWIEEEERSDWQKIVHFEPDAFTLVQSLRGVAFRQAAVFSDSLVTVCTTVAGHEPENDPFVEEPWQHLESCVASLHKGIAELRGMQVEIERHTRKQLGAMTLKENLSMLFDKFFERIGRACYAELVRARLPLRLADARRRLDSFEDDPALMEKMQAEVMRRDYLLTPEQAMDRVRERIEELSDLIESVVPMADAVDQRAAEFARRSLARFRYLQETTSDKRASVQDFFELLNKRFAGRRIAELNEEAAEFPSVQIQDAKLLAGLESLYSPRLRRVAGEIDPLDEEASEAQQDDAMRRLHAAMRDSMTVARANRFIDELLPEPGSSIRSEDIPLRCDDDLADLIAALLHARAADARYRVEVPRERADDDTAQFDKRLQYRIERFTISRK